ncbi:MAG TPA: glycosyltransferase family 39 protein [Terriglobales bacterium]|nr:glycosyltransferase family 39 protein [Terriglobales bacterium]
MSAAADQIAYPIRGEAERTGWGALPIVLLSAGIGLRVVFYFIGVNNGGDAIDRFSKAEDWLQHPDANMFFGAWLPLHFWMMAGIAKVFSIGVESAGRMLSLILGSASLFAVWHAARDLYGEKAAGLSLLVFAFYTLHVGYSTTSSAEVPYLFFALTGLALFFRYRRNSSIGTLMLSGLLFTLGAAIRYEAWVMMFAVALILLAEPLKKWKRKESQRESWIRLALFCTCAGLWPAFWMLENWRHFGHPLYYVAMQKVWVPEILAAGGHSQLYNLAVSPGTLLLTLSPVAFAAALYAFASAIRNQIGRDLAVIWLVVAGVQLYQTITAGMWPSARFTISQGGLLAIASGYGLLLIGERLRVGWKPLWMATLVLVSANLAFVFAVSESRLSVSDKFASISPRLRFTHYIQDVGDFLRLRLRPKDSVVIDNYNLESGFIAIAAGLSHDPGNRAFTANSMPPADVLNYVRKYHPRYFVIAKAGTLQPYLPLPAQCSGVSIEGLRLECVFQNSVYRVFESVR